MPETDTISLLPTLICGRFITAGPDGVRWNVARVCGRDDAQGAVAAAFIAKNFAGKKVAVIDNKSTYGKGLADVTRKGLEAAGVTLALIESFTAGEKDYTALVSKMKDAGVEAVYIGGYHSEEGVIARLMAEQGCCGEVQGRWL